MGKVKTTASRRFQFQATWASHEDFVNVVKRAWENNNCFDDKIDSTRDLLCSWSKTAIGDLEKRKRRILARLDGITATCPLPSTAGNNYVKLVANTGEVCFTNVVSVLCRASPKTKRGRSPLPLRHAKASPPQEPAPEPFLPTTPPLTPDREGKSIVDARRCYAKPPSPPSTAAHYLPRRKMGATPVVAAGTGLSHGRGSAADVLRCSLAEEGSPPLARCHPPPETNT
nr:Retrovirus-related Pol polyprotein LINE-1 [Ipomoea batatas]